MPQWRKIHPDYFDSPSVDAMCLAAQRLWQALWCLSDEWGRGKLAPRAIEGFAFPGRSINELTYGHHGTIDELLAEVAEHCSVVFYEVGHSFCWQCTSWGEYQEIKHKDRQSAVPAYEPGVHKRLYATSPNSPQVLPTSPNFSREGEGEGIVSGHLGSVGGPGGVSSDGDAEPPVPLPAKSPASSAVADAAPAKGPKARTGSRLPDDWTPADTPAVRALAAELGDPQAAARELDRFRDYWAAQPGAKGRKADWDATWRNWLRRAADDRANRPASGLPAEAARRTALIADAQGRQVSRFQLIRDQARQQQEALP